MDGDESLADITANELVIDTIPLTINIMASNNALNIGETAIITFTLSEMANDFDVNDITVVGGNLSNFTGSGTNYIATFTPNNESTANGVISVNSNKFRDAVGNENIGSNIITITLVHDNNPVAVNDVITINEGGTATGNVIANDTDADLPNDNLTVIIANAPTHGAVTLNSDGSFNYIHDGSENFNDSFTYTLSDANGAVNTATVKINITPVAEPPAPTITLNLNITADDILNATEATGNVLLICALVRGQRIKDAYRTDSSLKNARTF